MDLSKAMMKPCRFDFWGMDQLCVSVHMNERFHLLFGPLRWAVSMNFTIRASWVIRQTLIFTSFNGHTDKFTCRCQGFSVFLVCCKLRLKTANKVLSQRLFAFDISK